jgi:aryl-alcohol dehydrogenase-like predicted oxidoreductase
MKYRRFGRTGWEVSEIGYGMWGMGGWTGSDDNQSMAALHRSVELGCNFFDTAWAYGRGHSEGLLGTLVRAYPERILFTASKLPPKNFKWPGKPEYKYKDVFPYQHMVDYTEHTLKNLGLDHVDLMQVHVWDDAWAKYEDWQRYAEDMKQQGKIKAFGISINRWEPANAIKALRTGAVDAVQVIYNIFDQNPEDELFPVCDELDVAVIARVPFDEGSLTGTLTKDTTWPKGDWRNSYFVPENLNETEDRVETLRPLVPEGMTITQITMRFILSNSTVSTIIPGMRKLPHVEMNIGTSNAGPLDDELVGKLRAHRWVRTPTEWSQ